MPKLPNAIAPFATSLLLTLSAPAIANVSPNAPETGADEETAAAEQTLPPAIRQMLESAIAEGNESEIGAVAKYAARIAPQSQREIEELLTNYHQQKETQDHERRSNPNIFALWKGQIELGGFRSTGSASEFGISASLSAKREGLNWTHALDASIDYRRANGETSRERIVASYAPKYRLDDIKFIYGLAQYERDPLVGYNNRFSGSVGLGYKLISNDRMTLSVDAGPSLRHVEYADGMVETKVGGRSSADFQWKLSPTLTFHQTASGYAEKNVASFAALTALDAKLISVLTARFSYNVQYESDNKLTDERFDTLSKVTLIYDF